MSFLCYPLFLLYKLLNMFRATMCPSSGADDSVVLSPCFGIVPWLQECCQNRLAGSVSTEEFVARPTLRPIVSIQLHALLFSLRWISHCVIELSLDQLVSTQPQYDVSTV